MCRSDGDDGESDGVYFEPGAKCCSYYPVLPNFLVGGVLGDDDALARTIIEQRVEQPSSEQTDQRLMMTPLGIEPSPSFARSYAATAHTFGREAGVICPYYSPRDGFCGIWRHRNAVCSTWYCKHVRGAIGRRFWKRVRFLFTFIERELAQWCVMELKIDDAALASLFPAGVASVGTERADEEVDPWGAWAPRKLEFYRACSERVGRLSWPDVERICGPGLGIAATVLEASAAALSSEELPNRVELGPLEWLPSGGPAVRVETYSAYDPIDVPRELFDVLLRFGSGALEQARTAVAETEVELDSDLIRRLLDFEVLRPA